jgi:hypothetical protein
VWLLPPTSCTAPFSCTIRREIACQSCVEAGVKLEQTSARAADAKSQSRVVADTSVCGQRGPQQLNDASIMLEVGAYKRRQRGASF